MYGTFDIGSLHVALDAQRRARGMSWRDVAAEISERFEHVPSRAFSPSTLYELARRTVVERDGVLQMRRWLDRSVERFTPSHRAPDDDPGRVPETESDCIVQLDARAIWAANDARREERGITWKAAAAEIGGVTASSLAGLTRGVRVAFPSVARITRWLGQPAETFTRAARRQERVSRVVL
jgi:hypothetical protein